MSTLLSVRNLTTHFFTRQGVLRAVDGVDFEVAPGGVLGLVGESGCGKSVTALSLLGLVPPPGRVVAGEAIFAGTDLLKLSPARLRAVRGGQIAMIFQEPMTSLAPVYTVGDQLVEAITLHQKVSRREARERAAETLHTVGLPSPRRLLDDYPHQLSGGMRQKVMIAMALSCRPRLLIADEPTTALDVTVQAQILDLLRKARDEMGTAIILITHDLAVVAEMADEAAVMHAGRIVERAPVRALFARAKHPYTIGLLRALPSIDSDLDRLPLIEGAAPDPLDMHAGCRFAARCSWAAEECRTREPHLAEAEPGHHVACLAYENGWAPSDGAGPDAWGAPDVSGVSDYSGTWSSRGVSVVSAASVVTAVHPTGAPPLLTVKNLVKHFPAKRAALSGAPAVVRAVDGVSFEIAAGETLALVGESGCGKSTTGKAILRLVDATAGEVLFDGEDLLKLGGQALRARRKELQIIFQDPYGSLNPRMRAGDIVSEPLHVYGLARGRVRKERALELLERVGLAASHAERFPHEFSGGQRQRLAIARALATNPRLIVCDEPVSALDASTQAHVVNLLKDLQREYGMAYLFIAHNLAVVRHVAERVAVMYLGKIVESARKEELFREPLHPYTQALFAASPSADPTAPKRRAPLAGDVPSALDPPEGCRFHTRCPFATAECAEVEPPLIRVGATRQVACHLVKAGPEQATPDQTVAIGVVENNGTA